MASERDRIAQLAAGQRLLAFGFWTGELPEVARLHFLSVARAMPANSRYALFTVDASMTPAMSDLLGACGIAVVKLDFPGLMAEAGLAGLLRRTMLSRSWPVLERLAKQCGCAARFPWLFHTVSKRVTPRANLLMGGPLLSGVLMSDYVRVLVSSIVPGHAFYTDIDVAFPRPLDWIFAHRSFVYRGETFSYANSAMMSVTPESEIKNGVLLRLLAREGSVRPWVLFTDANCRACGLDVLPCDRLDPRWSPIGPNGPHYAAFLRRSATSAADLVFLKDKFDAIHWHNQWDKVPEAGSPYDLWMRELSDDRDAVADAEAASAL
jgi:hypothetical protein